MPKRKLHDALSPNCPKTGREGGAASHKIGYSALDAVSSWREVAPMRAAGIAY